MRYLLRETISAFRRAPVLASLSAAMVGLALFVVGLFALAAHNLRLAFDTLEERVEIVAYLRDNATSREISGMRETLSALPEVSAVEFVTKDQALAEARRELPEFQEVMSDLTVNPLPASLEMQLHPEARTQAAVEELAQQARRYPFVEDVEYGEEWVAKLFMLRRIGGLTAIVLGGAFGLGATLIIGVAVRIAVFARREEIKVMQLVGARDAFIRRPFLIEGAVTGAVGGLLALGLNYATFLAVFHYLFSIAWIPASWAGAGVLAGIGLGSVASRLAVQKHLRQI